MEKLLILIVGPSGSGKTTLVENLHRVYDIPSIVSYTTRPMREGEIQNRDHIFIDNEKANRILHNTAKNPTQKPLAYTIYGGYRYFTTIGQLVNPDSPILSYIIDEPGVIGILRTLDKLKLDIKLIKLKLNISNEALLKRGISKERIDRDETNNLGIIRYDLELNANEPPLVLSDKLITYLKTEFIKNL